MSRTKKGAKAAADKEFSWCVRAAADWCCEKCGQGFNPPTAQLQCSHFYSRKHNITRWFPDNAFAHCASCHAWLESRLPDFTEFYIQMRGRDKYGELMAYHHQVVHWTKDDFEAIAKHYKDERKRIEEMREAGWKGYIEPRNWEIENED